LERQTLAYWDEIDAFKTQLEKTKDLPPYTFYDGPPFATGLPHYGHICAGTIKVIFIFRFETHLNFSIRMLSLDMLLKLVIMSKEDLVGIAMVFLLNMKLIRNMVSRREMMFSR